MTCARLALPEALMTLRMTVVTPHETPRTCLDYFSLRVRYHLTGTGEARRGKKTGQLGRMLVKEVKKMWNLWG